MNPKENRKQVLDEAQQAVLADRNIDYGDPEDNFRDIASLWSAYKKVNFTRLDVAQMMTLVKIARCMTSPLKLDHYVDGAGYQACAYASAVADDKDTPLIELLGKLDGS